MNIASVSKAVRCCMTAGLLISTSAQANPVIYDFETPELGSPVGLPLTNTWTMPKPGKPFECFTHGTCPFNVTTTAGHPDICAAGNIQMMAGFVTPEDVGPPKSRSIAAPLVGLAMGANQIKWQSAAGAPTVTPPVPGAPFATFELDFGNNNVAIAQYVWTSSTTYKMNLYYPLPGLGDPPIATLPEGMQDEFDTSNWYEITLCVTIPGGNQAPVITDFCRKKIGNPSNPYPSTSDDCATIVVSSGNPGFLSSTMRQTVEGGTVGRVGTALAVDNIDVSLRQLLECYPDCDESDSLSIDDFICFQTFFAVGDPYADCDGSGDLNVSDFICFQTEFAIGC